MKGGRVSNTIAGLALLAASLGAAPPSVFMANPPNDAVVSIGDSVYLRARVNDFDPGGQVTQVDYYTNGVLLGSATAPPFAVWWTNAVGTNVEVRAVAIDNSLERGTSFVVRVTAEPPRPRNLMWTVSTSAPGEAQWNTRDFLWTDFQGGGRSALFHEGDAATIYSWDPVFIGVDGVPIPVSPSSTASLTTMMLYGGDILTGSLRINSMAVLTNYAGSLSFPGGTVVRYPAFGLTYNISRAPQGASVHLGTGPITVIDSRFYFDLMTNQFATLENEFYFEAQNGQPSLQPASLNSSNATAKFTGTLTLNALLSVNIGNGTRFFDREGAREADYHEWAGPIVVGQLRNMPLGFHAQGQFRSKGWLLSGNIRDGGGIATNRLSLQAIGLPVVRLTGSNTYAHGTVIGPPVSSPPSWVEVAPESSLGFGDVEVQSTLRLMGSQNINSNATVLIGGGRIIIDSGVKVRVSRLTLGGITYTAGVFSSTNSFGKITSNGTIRLPAVNLQPSVAITHPVTGAGYGVADALEVRAKATDQDSYIERVEFYWDGSLAGTRTNAPFNLSISNASIGPHRLQALVFDDDGGVGNSEAVNITIGPRIDAIRHVETNTVVLEFRVPSGLDLQVQASASLTPPAWSIIGNFPATGQTASYVLTNSIPLNSSARYYRLRSP